MNTEQNVHSSMVHCREVCGVKCISWSAIILGAFFILGLSFLLNLFCTAIGLSIYSVNDQGASVLTLGGMLGFAIGMIAITFFSGWIAGYFGRAHCDKKYCGSVQGFAAWCLALVLMVLLALPFSHFASYASQYLSHQTIENSIDAVTPDTKKNEEAPANKSSEEAVNDLGKGAFVLFLMFFLGGIAATIGGHVAGECCDQKCCNKNKVC